MSIFSKKPAEPKDDSFQTKHSPVLNVPKGTKQAPFESISSYQNELLLRGKIGMEPGVIAKESLKIEALSAKSDIINSETETEYAQVMKININQKFDESMG